MMRTGPKPLSLHISLASADAVSQEDAALRMTPMLIGIQTYQAHPYAAQKAEYETVWNAGSVSLRRVVGSDPHGAALVLVPSLINDSSILDLSAERSLARWLGERGMDVYILDWGVLCSDAEQSSLDMLITERLIAAVEYLSGVKGSAVSALGYCMGGTMLAAAAALKPGVFDRLVFLATPWDFHAGVQHLTRRVQFWAPQTMPRVEAKGFLPADWVQALFASLDPELAQRKFSRFAGMDQESEEARLFVAVEDWINSGPDIPAGVAKDTIEGWFIKNEPGQGLWVDISGLTNPSLVIASSKDRLVDFESACALGKVLPNVEMIDPKCGHIGMIAGRESVEKVWERISAFLIAADDVASQQ